MNQKYYKVSPNEEVALHKKAFEESKMRRLKEVREQEKLVSAALLNQTKSNKIQHVQDMLKHLKIEFEGKKKKEVDLLLKQLNNRFKSIGEGHNFAGQEDGKMKELTAAERALVTKRYKRAVSKILKEKAVIDASVAEQAELRKKIIAMEEDRKKAILSLPKPPPDPIASLKPIKVITSITKNQTVDSFALSHHNLQSMLSSFPEVLVEKVSEENQVDAKLCAKEEEIKYKVLHEKLLKETNEREEKAELRHKHALQEVQLKQQQEDLIGELNNLELKDRLHRKNVVAKMSNKIFLPPYQRLQESKMKQMNLEQAFENAYNPTPGDAMESYYKNLEESNSSCNLQNDSSEAKDKENYIKDKENTLDNLSVRRKDKDILTDSNQKENGAERSKEDSQPTLSRLEKLRMHIKQQKRSQKSSEDLTTNTIQNSNQSAFESSSSKTITATASTHHIESLQSMNISSACESQSWRFSTHAPTEDHSTSSITANGQERVLCEKLTAANLNYSQRLLEHQQDVLKFQESLLRNQVLNTKAAANHTDISSIFINKSLSSASKSQCLTQTSTMLSVALNSQHKLTSVSSGQVDDLSLKQYSLSKIDNSFSSFETSQQASEHSILMEKLTCEVQIQTSFVECDGTTQTTFNERTNESSCILDKNPSKNSDPELTLDSCAEKDELNSKVSATVIPNYEKIKNKEIALRQQYPELFARDPNSTERVRNYKQHIKDQQKKLKLVHEFKKEKNERNESIDLNATKDYEQVKGKQNFVLPKSFNYANKAQSPTKQQNLFFPVFDKFTNMNTSINVNNIREEYKQSLSSHLKQTNIVDFINNKPFIDKINSNSELSLRQSNVDLQLREKDLPSTEVEPDLLSNPPSTSKAVFKKNLSPFINAVPIQTNKLDDSVSLVSNHPIEKFEKEFYRENVNLETNSSKDRLNMLDSWLEKQSFSELISSVSPPLQILSKNIKPSLEQNYLNNSNFFHELYQNDIPDYPRINRVSEDPPFSPIYEVDEKTPYRLANVTSSITSLQEQFLSSPSVTNQSSPTVTFHSLPTKHSEFNYIDINSKLLSLKNDFNQLFADKESYTDKSLNLRDINAAISSNESSSEFYALQPLQQSSSLYLSENQAIQLTNRNIEVRNVQLNGKELLVYNSESSQNLESPLGNQTVNNFVSSTNLLQSDSNFIKLTQAVESSDDFDKFLRPAVVEDYKKMSEANYSAYNKASTSNNKCSDDTSSISSSGSLLFLPVSCSNQENHKNSSMLNSIYTTANENESPLLLKNKSSELMFNTLNQVHKESDQRSSSTPENTFYHLSTQVENSLSCQSPCYTPSSSNFFVHDSLRSSFIKPSLENYDKLSIESVHKNIYMQSQLEDVKTMPKMDIETQSSTARSVVPSFSFSPSHFSPANILSLSSKQFDVRKMSENNSNVSLSISELSDLQHMHQENMSNYSSQHIGLGSISNSMDLQEQDISSSDEEDQMASTMQQSAQQIYSQRSRNFVLPYFDDITMDFTARKISASSLPRMSMNIEQDSFIPLPHQKQITTAPYYCSAPNADKPLGVVENSSQDGNLVKANSDKSLPSMSAQLNVEDHINVEADHEDTFLRDLLEKKKFNDLTTELSVLSDLDLSIISGSVDWSSLAPFQNSVSPSQESLGKVPDLHSFSHLDDSQKVMNNVENSLSLQEAHCKSPKNCALQQSVKSLSENKPVTLLEENSVLKSESDHLKLDSDVVKEKLAENKKRTKSLYEQLPEVRQRNARKEKDEVLKRNRAKLKEYHEKLQRNLKKRAKKNR